MQILTREQGISFDRIAGYETCRAPEPTDRARIRRILYRAGTSLAYDSGLKIDPAVTKSVADKLGVVLPDGEVPPC